jgi:hypothetical protein
MLGVLRHSRATAGRRWRPRRAWPSSTRWWARRPRPACAWR